MKQAVIILLIIFAAIVLTLVVINGTMKFEKQDVAPWNELVFNTPEGYPVKISNYKDNVLLIVNTASKCGFTPQLAGLQKLQEKYGKDGLVVLGFPCDQFRNQEPESNATVQKCYNENHGVTFQLSEKIDVNGPNAHPIFVYLNNHFNQRVEWNFTKFLIGRDGIPHKRFVSSIEPYLVERDLKDLVFQ